MIKYLKLEDATKAYVLDIEADSFKPTKIWCVVVKSVADGTVKTFKEKEEFCAWLNNKEVGPESIFIGHNILSYDIPVLNRLWNIGIDPVSRCVDTFILSANYRPNLEGGHSLGEWGRRLNFPKQEFTEFDHFSEKMLEYCINDVELNYKLYLALTERMRKFGYSELSCEIEHKIRVVINDQQENGFWFDRERASSFRDELRRKQADLSENIRKLFPPRLEEVARYSFRRLKDGSPTSHYEKHRNKYPRIDHDGSEYVCFDYVEFNLGSPKQRVSRLLELGWVPTKFTTTKTEEFPDGFPKVDEDALVRFAEESGRPEVAALAEWLVLQGRASMLDTWFNNLGNDSRIHGRVITCGASTRRMTHNSPNTANIPSGAKAKYGHECRSFWSVEPGRNLLLVGYDASGLETAGLCHYLNNPKATEALLQEKPNDIHSLNVRRLSEALGRPVDRERGAKTTWYAWLYGAGLAKLGAILKGSPKDGQTVVDTFFKNVPGLKKLTEEVQDEWSRNDSRLRTIDGGFVWCPSQSAALNYLVQSNGAILMKLASICLDEDAKKLGIPFKLVGSIHDEGQLEVEEQYAKALGKLAVASITKAGQILKLNVAVTGDFHIGKSWAETH